MKRKNALFILMSLCSLASFAATTQMHRPGGDDDDQICLEDIEIELSDAEINQLVYDAKETGVLPDKLEVPRVIWLTTISSWVVMKYLQCAHWVKGCWSSLKGCVKS